MMTIALLVAISALSTKLEVTIGRIDAIVGVSAVDVESGRTVSIRGDESFPMASVFKLPLAIEVLHRVDAGELHLDNAYTITPADFSLGYSPIRDAANGKPVSLALRELIVAALSDSDNTAGDYLLRMVTPAAVTDRMRAIGAARIRVDRTEKEIIESFQAPDGVARYTAGPRDTGTPLAATALLAAIHRHQDGLTPASRDLLVQSISSSKNPARLALLLPQGTTVAHKTGTMPETLNDIGIITSPDGKHHIALAVFTKAAKKASAEERERVVAEIARQVYDAFTH